jgi:hypothetical protein
MVEPDRLADDNTHALRMPDNKGKNTDTHAEYVKIIAFPR